MKWPLATFRAEWGKCSLHRERRDPDTPSRMVSSSAAVFEVRCRVLMQGSDVAVSVGWHDGVPPGRSCVRVWVERKPGAAGAALGWGAGRVDGRVDQAAGTRLRWWGHAEGSGDAAGTDQWSTFRRATPAVQTREVMDPLGAHHHAIGGGGRCHVTMGPTWRRGRPAPLARSRHRGATHHDPAGTTDPAETCMNTHAPWPKDGVGAFRWYSHQPAGTPHRPPRGTPQSVPGHAREPS
jgi:hypothetical protein